MENIVIEKTDDTPSVSLDFLEGKIEISERSLPENAIDFYKPILEWVGEYSENPKEKTIVNINLEYFNTSSAKQIAKLLMLFKKLSINNLVNIKWYYSTDDSDMKYSGERFSKLLKLKFEFIEFSGR